MTSSELADASWWYLDTGDPLPASYPRKCCPHAAVNAHLQRLWRVTKCPILYLSTNLLGIYGVKRANSYVTPLVAFVFMYAWGLICLYVSGDSINCYGLPKKQKDNSFTSRFLPCSAHSSLVRLTAAPGPNAYPTSNPSTQSAFYSHLSHINRLPGSKSCTFLAFSRSLPLSLRKLLLSLAACILAWRFFSSFSSCTLYPSANPSTPWEHPSVWFGSRAPLDYFHLLYIASVWDIGVEMTWLGIRSVWFLGVGL